MKYRTGRPYRVRMELVRQRGSAKGAAETGYELVLPLNPDHHIDATSWTDDPGATSICHFQAGRPPVYGRLARTPSGRWYFDYASGHDAEHHQGIRKGDESFHPGAFISVNESDGNCRTFRVTAVEPFDR